MGRSNDNIALYRSVEEHLGFLVEFLRRLVEAESPSDDKAAVDACGRIAEELARQVGCKVKRHRQRGFGDGLELRWGTVPKRSDGRGRILLLGHLDTVWPLGTLATMPWRESKGKIYGPGVLDMKAGVAMALKALRVLREIGVTRPVTLLLNSEEEIGSPFSRAITE
ncbi:MAG TPA: M20/M25/M40 family metallo-hydrolase, partial [Acidobacteriaceae bacterium]